MDTNTETQAKKPGRPKKVQTGDDFIPMPGGPKRVRERHASSGTVLDLPDWVMKVLEANEISLQWVAVSTIGDHQINRTSVQGFRQGGGWEIVSTDMFPYRGKPIFQGMFYPPDYIGEIEVGGQVLHWRPLELTRQALIEMAQEARMPIDATIKNLKAGHIEGTTGHVNAQTPKAKAWQMIEETVEPPIPVPD